MGRAKPDLLRQKRNDQPERPCGVSGEVTATGRRCVEGPFPVKVPPLPGRHVTDHQMRLYMTFRQTDGPAVSAAKAAISTPTAYRFEQDHRLPSLRRQRRGRRRLDPLAEFFDAEVVLMLTAAPRRERYFGWGQHSWEGRGPSTPLRVTSNAIPEAHDRAHYNCTDDQLTDQVPIISIHGRAKPIKCKSAPYSAKWSR